MAVRTIKQSNSSTSATIKATTPSPMNDSEEQNQELTTRSNGIALEALCLWIGNQWDNHILI